jgi:segregation and condensation protein B
MNQNGNDDAGDLGLDQFESADDHGLSLEELSRAYAELIGGGNDPYEASAEEMAEAAEEAQQPADALADEPPAGDDACELSPRSILEAILFVGHPGNRPLESQEIAALMRGVPAHEVDEMVRELNAAYDAEHCPYTIRSRGAGYQLELRGEFHALRDKVYGRIRAARLTQAAIDVLAVVAYNQPLTREQVDEIRGKPSAAILAQLVRRQLVALKRITLEDKKRRTVYSTTERFLSLFGLSSLEELPQGQDLDRPTEW